MGVSGRGLRLPFRLLGVPVTLDYSFLLILPLFAYLIGSQIGAYALLLSELGVGVDPAGLEEGATPWLLGAIAAVGLFASVLVHELGHAVVARLYGVEVVEIRLWFLGGVARFDTMPRGRGAEAVVAIAGPVTSVAVGALLWWALPAASGRDGLTVVVSYLAMTNLVLAIFNMLPALPLDGGRVLRGLLSLFMPHLRATNIAAFISAVIAILLGLYGFFSMNFLLVILAFFIYNAGRAEVQAAALQGAFEGRSAADLMTRDPLVVELSMPLSQFERMAHYQPYAGYPVVDAQGELRGYARINDAAAALAQATAAAGEGLTVADILLEPETVHPDETAFAALAKVAEGKLGRLLVVDDAGRLVGVIGKSDLLTLLRRQGGGPEPFG